jgi:hypothetical protein
MLADHIAAEGRTARERVRRLAARGLPGVRRASVDQEPAQLRMILGSDALKNTLKVLRDRIAGFEAQTELAASTDYPPGQ